VVNNEHLTEALRRLRKNTSDNNVDRRLVNNILISFLSTSRADSKRFEMLNLLSTILGWDDREREKAGLQRTDPKAGGKGKAQANKPGVVRKDSQGREERSAEEEAAMNEVSGFGTGPTGVTVDAILALRCADSRLPSPSPTCSSNSCSKKPPKGSPLDPTTSRAETPHCRPCDPPPSPDQCTTVPRPLYRLRLLQQPARLPLMHREAGPSHLAVLEAPAVRPSPHWDCPSREAGRGATTSRAHCRVIGRAGWYSREIRTALGWGSVGFQHSCMHPCDLFSAQTVPNVFLPLAANAVTAVHYEMPLCS
jgi:hypothetical protein